MSLTELCDPLFQYICRLNAAARAGSAPGLAQVRTDIQRLFQQMENTSTVDIFLRGQYQKIEMPLIFFVDAMIADSTLPFAEEWSQDRLAYRLNELAGDEKFFDLLDETIEDNSDEAIERLTIFYHCIGLGFTGWYSGQVEPLQERMREIFVRIRGHLELDGAQAILSPDALKHVDKRNLIERPMEKLVPFGLVLLVLLIVFAVSNVIIYRQASRDLVQKLRHINSYYLTHDQAGPRKDQQAPLVENP